MRFELPLVRQRIKINVFLYPYRGYYNFVTRFVAGTDHFII